MPCKTSIYFIHIRLFWVSTSLLVIAYGYYQHRSRVIESGIWCAVLQAFQASILETLPTFIEAEMDAAVWSGCLEQIISCLLLWFPTHLDSITVTSNVTTVTSARKRILPTDNDRVIIKLCASQIFQREWLTVLGNANAKHIQRIIYNYCA